MRIYTPQPLGGAVASKVSHLRIWFIRKCDLFPFLLVCFLSDDWADPQGIFLRGFAPFHTLMLHTDFFPFRMF